jgi:hypothetical protein
MIEIARETIGAVFSTGEKHSRFAHLSILRGGVVARNGGVLTPTLSRDLLRQKFLLLFSKSSLSFR